MLILHLNKLGTLVLCYERALPIPINLSPMNPMIGIGDRCELSLLPNSFEYDALNLLLVSMEFPINCYLLVEMPKHLNQNSSPTNVFQFLFCFVFHRNSPRFQILAYISTSLCYPAFPGFKSVRYPH